ncbi:MAG TPA: hypothetical protein VFS18_04060, partial [Actinomycetota bacterium]|nr:hypothetical protein [Actinomycetota bacterium]
GFFLDEEDPATGTPLLYATTGRTGLQVFDLADPAAPVEVGAWDGVGLAEVEVRATKRKRVVYAATEYWFDGSLVPEIVVLDASKLDAIERSRRLAIGAPADDAARVQGMTLHGDRILVAHSSLGTMSLTKNGRVKGVARYERPRNEGAGVTSSPYSFDVEASGRYIYIADAATGRLHTVVEGFSYDEPHGR